MKLRRTVADESGCGWRYRVADDDYLVTLLESLEHREETVRSPAAVSAGRRKRALPGLDAVLDLIKTILLLLAVGVGLLILCGWAFVNWLTFCCCSKRIRRPEPAVRAGNDQPVRRKAA